ncbi:50S ribosomal protein L4 [Nitrococcus mobilis]|uniref:Large ribosomal subunit protein uL4 n=1 Tax=Nitrococcus mobilis Nb-231 TaxID=314278 RepID=A4BT47_9GAMM|nr:50S ribosomal protein L4 [Nitrococcus mobilis]EAR21115.1 50S ribosomal protein L4 [Nitrococcus mobilis Nb-231]
MELPLREGAGAVQVSERTFGAEFKEPLIHQVVVAYLAGGRAGSKAQKDRAAVRGGGAKPWRQKGTGRARAGSIRSPLWRGGGRSFASAPRDHSQKVNRKMYRGALRAILSELVRQERLCVMERFDLAQPKTKLLLDELGSLGFADVLIVSNEPSENVRLAARNLAAVDVWETNRLNPVVLLRHEKVLLTVDAVHRLEEWLG